MIQKRTITVISGQPSSSKWWWIGAMRNTRRPVSRNDATWMITDSVSITNRPPRMSSSSCVSVMMARPASSPPMASEPVSPMKIRAGAAFHHRKPADAPIIAAATMRQVEAAPEVVAAGRRPAARVAELPERR